MNEMKIKYGIDKKCNKFKNREIELKSNDHKKREKEQKSKSLSRNCVSVKLKSEVLEFFYIFLRDAIRNKPK